jgi:hypothetical protein
MLAFFPWLRIERDLSGDGYELVQFARGLAPGGAVQPAVDAVLRPYVSPSGDRPVDVATLLRPRGTDITADLSEDQIDDLFAVAELVAFAGLAARRYFRQLEYCNRDTFTFVVQSFQDPAGHVGLRVRRRDGSTGIMVSPNAYRVHRPYHVPMHDRVGIDGALLGALLTTHGIEGWTDLEDSIFFFNQANSDRDLTPLQWETVATLSSFERILGVPRAGEDELAGRFLEVWPVGEGEGPTCERIPADQRAGRSVREVWLRDLYRHRGASAHGRRESRHRALWTPSEHLLLGAFAFPLLAKILLARGGHYSLTAHDQTDLQVFEELACADHFQPRAEDDTRPHPWSQIRDGAQSHRALRAAVDRALEEHRAAEDD